MKIYIYVIRSEKDGRDYVGMTIDLARRLKEHNSGKTRSTRFYVPWNLVHYEVFDNREEARNREKYLKSGYGKKWIKNRWPRSSAG